MLEFEDALNWASEINGCFFPPPATPTLVEVKIAMTAIVGHDSRHPRYEVCIQCFIQKIHHLEYGKDLESYFCWMHFHALPILATVLRRPATQAPSPPPSFGVVIAPVAAMPRPGWVNHSDRFRPQDLFFFWTPSKWPINGGYSPLTGMIQATQTMDYPRANGCPILMVFLCILPFGNFSTHGED